MRTYLSRRRTLGQRAAASTPILLLALCAALLFALPASATDKGISLGLLGGVGGSPDSDNFTGASFQLMASWEWRVRTMAQVRVGGLDLDLDRGGSIQPADLTYITLSTEYRNNSDFYDSGVIIGIGYYSLESDAVFGPNGLFAADDEDSIGLNLGVSGHFDVTDRWSIPVELMAHYADFDQVQFFFTAQVGLLYSF